MKSIRRLRQHHNNIIKKISFHQKKQGRVCNHFCIHSKFEPQVLIGHLKPDLNALDICLNLKDVQLPATEIKYALFGVNPNCAQKASGGGS